MGQFITPPTIPEDTYCRRILIPNTPEWIGTVTGALMPLIYASEWVQTTGVSPQEAAERAQEMFNLYVNSGNDGECGDMACCEEKVIIHRYNPVTGRPEISDDGGETWKPDPADVQNQIPLYPPLVTDGGSSTKCDAATNASEHINELIDATGENLNTAGDVFTLAVGIAEAVLALFLILISAGTLAPIVTAVATAIWAAASAAFSLGYDLYMAYWTTDKKDAILCALFCNIGEDGQFTEAQYQAVRAKIKGQLPASPALDIVMTAINAGGARGLSQMASYGNAAEADCSSCDCGEIGVYNVNQTTGVFDLLLPDEGTDNIYTIEAGLYVPTGNYAFYQFFQDNGTAPLEGGHYIDAHLVSGTTYSNGYIDKDTGSGIPSSWAAIPDCAGGLWAESGYPFTVQITVTPCP